MMHLIQEEEERVVFLRQLLPSPGSSENLLEILGEVMVVVLHVPIISMNEDCLVLSSELRYFENLIRSLHERKIELRGEK
jgi:hypothetical protein